MKRQYLVIRPNYCNRSCLKVNNLKMAEELPEERLFGAGTRCMGSRQVRAIGSTRPAIAQSAAFSSVLLNYTCRT